jgi:FkbM family methyltransferase
LGAKPGVLEFIENTRPWLSSFLEPGADCWGEIKQRSQIEVRTIDGYCAERGITIIDILKSDTQGFDLEVIKGAACLLEQRRIQLIYMEITFCSCACEDRRDKCAGSVVLTDAVSAEVK